MSAFRKPYRGYDVLAKWDSVSWNDATRQVMRKRLTEVPPRRFLSKDEWNLLRAVCARLVPQPDRADDPVPIAPWIDAKLHDNQGDGYRYEGMPPMREAWRLGLEGLEREAQRRQQRSFPSLSEEAQDAVLTVIQRGEVEGPPWDRLAAQPFFEQLLQTVVGVYYAHPAAWSETGFGGPASPRGYVRLEPDRRDPWEAKVDHAG